MSTRALITGITDQDGPYLAFLLERGYEVFGVGRRLSAPDTWRIQHIVDRITLLQAELLDQLSLIKVVEKVGPRELYNLAAVPTHAGRMRLSDRRRIGAVPGAKFW